MNSFSEYKTVDDVIRDLNVMILESPIPNNVMNKFRYIVDELEAEVEDE